MAGKKEQYWWKLSSEVRRWQRVVSLMDCVAVLLHGMSGADSHNLLLNAHIYHRWYWKFYTQWNI